MMVRFEDLWPRDTLPCDWLMHKAPLWPSSPHKSFLVNFLEHVPCVVASEQSHAGGWGTSPHATLSEHCPNKACMCHVLCVSIVHCPNKACIVVLLFSFISLKIPRTTYIETGIKGAIATMEYMIYKTLFRTYYHISYMPRSNWIRMRIFQQSVTILQQ